MAFCGKCGTEVNPGAAFCPKCGAPQAAAPVNPPPPPGTYVPPPGGFPPPGAPTAGMAENVAGLLCYVLGWITGLIFFLIDKRPFVRFHAAQSIVTFGALHVISILIFFSHFGGLGLFGFSLLLHSIIWLLSVVLWILCMVKAYQHEMFRVPIAAQFADQLAGKQI